MKFEYWFPTVLAVHHAEDNCRNATKEKISKWIESGEHTKYLEACREDNLTTSYFKWHDTLGDLKLTELRAEILAQAAKFIEHMGLNLETKNLKVDSWINFFCKTFTPVYSIFTFLWKIFVCFDIISSTVF